MYRYVLGFAFDPSGHQVVLIHKRRPAFQAGLWNGVGGKIEEGETPVAAMVREFAEETGLIWEVDCWVPTGTVGDEDFIIHVFGAQGDITSVQSLTDEPVAIHPIETLANLPVVADLFQHLGRLQAYGLPQVRSVS